MGDNSLGFPRDLNTQQKCSNEPVPSFLDDFFPKKMG